MASPQLKFQRAIVCDDIRKEISGKLILIGVYASAIVVKEFPANLLLSLAIPCHADRAFEAPIDFRISFEKKQRGTGRGTVRVTKPGDTYFVVPSVPLEGLDREGTLTFDVKIDGQRWKSVLSMPVMQQSSTSS